MFALGDSQQKEAGKENWKERWKFRHLWSPPFDMHTSGRNVVRAQIYSKAINMPNLERLQVSENKRCERYPKRNKHCCFTPVRSTPIHGFNLTTTQGSDLKGSSNKSEASGSSAPPFSQKGTHGQSILAQSQKRRDTVRVEVFQGDYCVDESTSQSVPEDGSMISRNFG